jgi:hypothetical protein
VVLGLIQENSLPGIGGMVGLSAHRANSLPSAMAFPIWRRASRLPHCSLARTCATSIVQVMREATLRSDTEMYRAIAPPLRSA